MVSGAGLGPVVSDLLVHLFSGSAELRGCACALLCWPSGVGRQKCVVVFGSLELKACRKWLFLFKRKWKRSVRKSPDYFFRSWKWLPGPVIKRGYFTENIIELMSLSILELCFSGPGFSQCIKRVSPVSGCVTFIHLFFRRNGSNFQSCVAASSGLDRI